MGLICAIMLFQRGADWVVHISSSADAAVRAIVGHRACRAVRAIPLVQTRCAIARVGCVDVKNLRRAATA